MSIAAVSSTPLVPLPTTATTAQVLANNAGFQQSLLQTNADAAQSATSSYNALPLTQVLGNDPNAAFQASLVDTSLTALSPTSSNDAFPTYLTDTYLGASSTPAPNPFGTTLAELALGSPAYSTPVVPNPFAQQGLGIHVSALQ